jgi:pimeloyl-ACP methyl ester carboxylesterase
MMHLGEEDDMSNTHGTAKTQFLETNGVRYAYRLFGSGDRPPLLCLQHFRGGLDNWDPQVTDGLAQGRPVILFNNAGIASSSGRPANNIAEMATHVIGFLDALKLKEIDLLGFSHSATALAQCDAHHLPGLRSRRDFSVLRTVCARGAVLSE